ncbi:MAG: AI-2E family transporter [Erysipelotrichaceae bacterium]|nr:AI-2E family transporter [Erysipelotrichaceae bacterium]
MKQKFQTFSACAMRLLPIVFTFLLTIILLKQIELYATLTQLLDALYPVFGGVVIAFLLQPIIDRLQLHMKNKTAVVLVYVSILFIVLIFLIALLPILYRQIVDFSKFLPEWTMKIETFLKQYDIVLEQLSKYKNSIMEEGTNMVVTSLRSMFSTTTKYGIAYITAFFISIDLDFWKRSAKKLFHNYHQFVTFYKTMSNIVYQYLIGTLLDLGFVAVTSGVILYAADFPNVLLYAILLALSNLFPYIGPTVGLLFIILVGALSYDVLPWFAFFLIWLTQQIEANFVQPMIFNKTMDVRPILTFVALFVAEALFGIPGVLLSPIFASIMQIAFRSYLHAKTKDTIGKWEDIWYDFDEAMKDIPIPEDT